MNPYPNQQIFPGYRYLLDLGSPVPWLFECEYVLVKDVFVYFQAYLIAVGRKKKLLEVCFLSEAVVSQKKDLHAVDSEKSPSLQERQ